MEAKEVKGQRTEDKGKRLKVKAKGERIKGEEETGERRKWIRIGPRTREDLRWVRPSAGGGLRLERMKAGSVEGN